MFKHAVVGVDAEERGSDAIALASVLKDADGKLTLAHVYRRDPPAWRVYDAAFQAEQEERGRTLLEQVRQEAGLEADLRCLGSPTVGRGLHELATELGADLIVVGSSRRGRIGRVLLGDETWEALNGSPCAVAVAPGGWAQRSRQISRVGVGYDGSPESGLALEAARALATELGAKLAAFHAVLIPVTVSVGGVTPILFEEPSERLEEARREITAACPDAEPHAAFGVPSEELALFSGSVDLLVIGSRSYGPLGRLVIGSTERALARSTRCPLLVLPRAGEPK
jgi:nucleotide-binding universal stress UspA family protein